MNSIYLFYFSPSTFRIPNIFHAPIEPIPFDSGWIGFAFIFVNGLLLSYVLARDGVDITERLLLSIGLGFGVTYVVMILIGMLWEISLLTIILTQVSLFITLLLAAFCRGLKLNFNGYLRLKKKNGYIPKFNLFEAILLIVIGIFVIVAIYQTIAYPAIEWDSLAYGVNYAKIIFENGKIPLIAGPSIGLEMSASYPPGVQLLAVYLYVFAGNAGDFYFRILQPIFGLATILATYKFAMIVTKNRTAAVFAMFALSSMSTFWELFVHETYLMCLTLMLTLAAFFFFKAYNSSDTDAKKYEIIGTLFCCFSALTSYIGMFSFGLLLLYSVNRKLSAKRVTWLAIFGPVIVLPWYIRNFILLGNPIFPFFGIGNYLDPVLFNSSTQHFQNWSNVPFFDLISIICKIGAGILFLAIMYFTFAKRKQFHLILPFYLFLVGLIIMGLHIPFVRYLIIALPALAVILAASTKSLRPTHTLVERMVAIILISLVLVSSVMVLPCINSLKPTPTRGDDKWSYLSQVFEEGDAWQWINENTPTEARIATYDIKEYYIERDIFTLDGNEAAPLYKMDTIEESIAFLEEMNVTYVLSVPWTAPLDPRIPPAYKWCVLTRYFGDPRYLPPVYVGLNGTAVYHVGPLEEETVYAYFAQEDFAPPIKHVTINLTIANETYPSSGKFYMPIPVDYKEGLMMASVNSCKHLVDVELWNGIIPETMSTSPLEKSKLVKKWPIQSANSSGVENPSFIWQINKAGYFTFLIVDREETFKESFNVTVDIRFYNYWDIKSLFISEGLEIYNITASNETFPLLKTLYIQANESSSLSIKSTTANKKISLEIFTDLLPNNAAINWSAQYEMVTRQPNLNNDSGEVDPSLQNLFLPYGLYSILVVYRDSYTEKVDISLEVEFTSLR
ncbi:MAG: ArnT family glycosyltransferase [Promethearchaeota archaeon]